MILMKNFKEMFGLVGKKGVRSTPFKNDYFEND